MFDIPTVADIIASSTTYSSALFSTFIALVIGVAIGVPLAFYAIKWLIRSLNRGIKSLFKGGRGRRGFRRR